MMIARRYYGEDNQDLPIRNKIVGWDVIIPIHSNTLKSWRDNEPTMRFTSTARFWWNNLYFAGGRVIGYEQKLFMRLEMKMKQLIFPVDYIDCSASAHYWLRYYKLLQLQTYFRKPKSKRINPYPMYPYSLWPNVLNLFKDESESITELNGDEMQKNLVQINKHQQQLINDKNKNKADSKEEDEDIDIEMDIQKQLQYIFNHTLWGLKNDCKLMNDIHLNLKQDVIEKFDTNWNKSKQYQYFIVRDKKNIGKY